MNINTHHQSAEAPQAAPVGAGAGDSRLSNRLHLLAVLIREG